MLVCLTFYILLIPSFFLAQILTHNLTDKNTIDRSVKKCHMRRPMGLLAMKRASYFSQNIGDIRGKKR